MSIDISGARNLTSYQKNLVSKLRAGFQSSMPRKTIAKASAVVSTKTSTPTIVMENKLAYSTARPGSEKLTFDATRALALAHGATPGQALDAGLAQVKAKRQPGYIPTELQLFTEARLYATGKGANPGQSLDFGLSIVQDARTAFGSALPKLRATDAVSPYTHFTVATPATAPTGPGESVIPGQPGPDIPGGVTNVPGGSTQPPGSGGLDLSGLFGGGSGGGNPLGTPEGQFGSGLGIIVMGAVLYLASKEGKRK